MNYRKISTSKLLVVAILVILAGITLQPRLANQYIAPIRSSNLDSFIQKSIREQSINRKDFWEFRDKYSLGKFSINPSNQNDILLFLVGDTDFVPHLSYSSKNIMSLGGQTNQGSFSTKTSLPDILIESSSTRVLKTEDGGFIILTITPLSEEKRFNGFLNKIKLVEGKDYWLEVTKITK